MADKTPTPLDHIKTELRRFFGAGQGHEAIMLLEKFTITIAEELINSKVPTLVQPLVSAAESFAEGKIESATDAALSGLTPADPTPTAGAQVSASPSTAADNAPVQVFRPTPEQSAFMRTLAPAQLVAYVKAHA